MNVGMFPVPDPRADARTRRFMQQNSFYVNALINSGLIVYGQLVPGQPPQAGIVGILFTGTVPPVYVAGAVYGDYYLDKVAGILYENVP